jgi:hypothetical protein
MPYQSSNQWRCHRFAAYAKRCHKLQIDKRTMSMLPGGKVRTKSYKMLENPPAEHLGSKVHVDLLPFNTPTIGGNNLNLL